MSASGIWTSIAWVIAIAVVVVIAWVCATLGAKLDRLRWAFGHSLRIRFRAAHLIFAVALTAAMMAASALAFANWRSGYPRSSPVISFADAQRRFAEHYPDATELENVRSEQTSRPGHSRAILWQYVGVANVMPTRWVEINWYGWPFRCIEHSSKNVSGKSVGGRWNPVWNGIAANSAVFIVPAFTAIIVVGIVRRMRRVLRWRCPDCGYAVSTVATCSECGRDLSLLIRSDSRLN